jgi:hypothetical protein
MSTAIITAVATLLGIVITHFFTRKKYQAEVEKLKTDSATSKAEAEKFKAEAERSTAEAEKFRAETEKIRHDLSSIIVSSQSKEHGTAPHHEITVLPTERSLLSEFYLDQIVSSTNIDIIALTLQTALEHFGLDRFIQWIKDRKHIRILMLSPDSDAAKVRGIEEDSNENFLVDKIILQIKALRSLYIQAEKDLNQVSAAGSLEVRLYDELPYFSYFHTDKAMVMGLYYVHIRGLQSEALLIDETSSIHAKMCNHFDKIWIKSGESGAPKMTVCIISKDCMMFNNSLLETPRTHAESEGK